MTQHECGDWLHHFHHRFHYGRGEAGRRHDNGKPRQTDYGEKAAEQPDHLRMRRSKSPNPAMPSMPAPSRATGSPVAGIAAAIVALTAATAPPMPCVWTPATSSEGAPACAPVASSAGADAAETSGGAAAACPAATWSADG